MFHCCHYISCCLLLLCDMYNSGSNNLRYNLCVNNIVYQKRSFFWAKSYQLPTLEPLTWNKCCLGLLLVWESGTSGVIQLYLSHTAMDLRSNPCTLSFVCKYWLTWLTANVWFIYIHYNMASFFPLHIKLHHLTKKSYLYRWKTVHIDT